MRCPKCRVPNNARAKFCQFCGQPLTGVKRRFKWVFVLPLVLAGVISWLFFSNQQPSPQSAPTVAPKPPTQNLPSSVSPRTLPVEPQPVAPQPIAETQHMLAGAATLYDITGRRLTVRPVGLLAGGYMALPEKSLMGAYHATFSGSAPRPLRVQRVITDESDKVAVLQVAAQNLPDLFALEAWTPNQPVAWLALQADAEPRPITVEPVEYGHRTVQVKVPQTISEPGILIQTGRVVGWTFGKGATHAFLWTGPAAGDLPEGQTVIDYYQKTFADGREEQFLLANSIPADKPLQRLAHLTEGFRLDPRLALGDTPPPLQPQAIVPQMIKLIAATRQAGMSGDIIRLVDETVLTAAADARLLLALGHIVQESHGAGDALDLIETVQERTDMADSPPQQQLTAYHRELYLRLISQALADQTVTEAELLLTTGLAQFPQDPHLNLLGVRLALADGDWATAEKLLYARQYPPALAGKINVLQDQIETLKNREGKIVIRFTPGANHVPVTARLNRSVTQPFIIDTGASMVTIPQSTAEYLGIQLSDNTPQRKIITAGGVMRAYEVTLESIELQGWVVNNVNALVVDIPEQSDLGLLGLNFLNRFEMNLNSREGLLILAPR